MATLVGIAVLAAGCDSSPQGVEIVEIEVADRVATHDGLEVAWTRVNYGWVPAEGPIPDRDSLTVTIELRVRNVSDEPRSFAATDLLYRTWDLTYPYDPPRNTPVWSSASTGRHPLLEPGRLGLGQEVSGWRTYRVPRDAGVPDALVWRAAGDRRFTFWLPTSSGSLVCGVSRVFGTVTTPEGAPLSAALVELVHFDLSRPENAFEEGRCC